MLSRLRKHLCIPKFNSFEELPTWAIALLGGISFLPAVFYGHMVAKMTPSLMDATDKASSSWIGLALWLFDGILALYALHFFWIAKRCGIFYKRVYK